MKGWLDFFRTIKKNKMNSTTKKCIQRDYYFCHGKYL